MITVIQRVSSASVSVAGEVTGRIGTGFLCLVGVEVGDTPEIARTVADKIRTLRLFSDEHGKMNLSLAEVGGQVLAVSQFTLAGDVRKGRRPSFVRALPGEPARLLYEEVVAGLRQGGVGVETGVFGASMEVALVNDGPVTIVYRHPEGAP